MLYLLYKIGIFLALTLPLKASYWLANICGSIYYLLAKRDKKIAADNMRVILGQDSEKRKIYHLSRMVFVGFARYLVDFFRSAKIDLKYIERYIKVEGRGNLDKALKLGRGVLLVSAHLGNWELGAMVLSMLGYKINIVAWTHKNKRINEFFLNQRQNKGIAVIPLGIGIRGVFSALKNNESVAFLGDIDYLHPEIGIKVKLFGRDTIIPQGPAAFSLKTGSPVVPVFMVREKGARFKFILEEPIIYAPSADKEFDMVRLTEKIAKTIERYIGLYPEQWFMINPRWKEPV